MSQRTERPRCPHCQQPLQVFRMPDNSGWQEQHQWACFNDDCPYYREGWTWMWNNYRVRSSYRFRLVNADDHTGSPLPVWSATALRDRIVAEPAEDSPVGEK